MTKQRRILNLIEAIRDSHPQMTNIYLNGSCLNFFCILRRVYPEARPWFNIDHIITEIDGRFYDVTGQVFPNDSYQPYTWWYRKDRMSASFGHMHKAGYPLVPLN